MSTSRRRPISEINVVPYIDVMLVLLVIFMITTPLLTQGVKIDMPKAQAQAISSEHEEPIIVSVNEKGDYFLNISQTPEKIITAQNLVNRVAAELLIAKQANHKRMVLIKGDRNVDYGKVVQAMVLLQHAGVASVGLMTEPQQERQA